MNERSRFRRLLEEVEATEKISLTGRAKLEAIVLEAERAINDGFESLCAVSRLFRKRIDKLESKIELLESVIEVGEGEYEDLKAELAKMQEVVKCKECKFWQCNNRECKNYNRRLRTGVIYNDDGSKSEILY